MNGVLRFFTSLEESLMERLQREFPGLRFVKRSTRSATPAWSIRNSGKASQPCSFAATTSAQRPR